MTRILLVIATFIWCGLLIGISFMETPLKFQAPGITLELGLGIGSLVFNMLNNMELVLGAIAAVCLFTLSPGKRLWIPFGIVLVLLLVQTFYFLPVLDTRADMVIAGETPPDSPIHLMYIFAEIAKLGLLLWGGVVFLKDNLE